MTFEQYYKRIGVNNHEEYIQKRDMAWNFLKSRHGDWLKSLGIETLEDCIKWFDKEYKGIPIGLFVTPIPEELKTDTK